MIIPAKLKLEVKRLFENTATDEFSGNRKTGSINCSALASTATGNVRVFKRRTEVAGIDSAVVICLDVSGSMNDRDLEMVPRLKYAVETAAALLETLSAAGVATCILTYAQTTSILKPWGMNAKRAKERLSRLDDHGTTKDYFCIRYAHTMLLQRPEERKVCFVITDGDGDKERTKAQVKSGSKLGITTIGIGIELNIKSEYPNSIHVKKTSDLGTESFKQIKLAA